jgi:hypothetical protein
MQDSVFQGNSGAIALIIYNGVTVSNSVFVDNRVAVAVGSYVGRVPAIFTNNSFTGNQTAIFVNDTSPYTPLLFRYNEIYDNAAGLQVSYWCNAQINYNNIYNNGNSIQMNQGDCEVDLTNNWWGTADKSVIDAMIIDFKDDFELAKAIYEPFATTPIPNIGAP